MSSIHRDERDESLAGMDRQVGRQWDRSPHRAVNTVDGTERHRRTRPRDFARLRVDRGEPPSPHRSYQARTARTDGRSRPRPEIAGSGGPSPTSEGGVRGEGRGVRKQRIPLAECGLEIPASPLPRPSPLLPGGHVRRRIRRRSRSTGPARSCGRGRYPVWRTRSRRVARRDARSLPDRSGPSSPSRTP